MRKEGRKEGEGGEGEEGGRRGMREGGRGGDERSSLEVWLLRAALPNCHY